MSALRLPRRGETWRRKRDGRRVCIQVDFTAAEAERNGKVCVKGERWSEIRWTRFAAEYEPKDPS